MPRHAKPVDLHVISGNPNRLTKAEIASRKESEIKIGSTVFTCPDFVRSDSIAFSKWQEITKEYKLADVEFVTSSDIGHIARYCRTFSEYRDLIGHRERIQSIDSFTMTDQNEFMIGADAQVGEKAAANLWQKVEYLLSLNGLMAIDKAINAKMQALNAMEDRLFLNPLAKVKNVPKREPKQKEDPNKQMFGD